MNALDVNEELNNLKDKYPGDVALVESVQNLFNKEFQVISDRSLKALKTFPMQFTKRIPTSSGEWTTQLHIWADNQVPALLDIDPIILTARNSDGETVLMSLLMAATGRFTQQVNYALIKKILDTDMQFEYLTEPMDENSVETGNVWDEEDLDHKTALQYLADFAKGTGPFLGAGGDDAVRKMLEDFADRPEPDNGPGDGEPLSDPNFDAEKAQEQIEQAEAMRDAGKTTSAADIAAAEQSTQPQPEQGQPEQATAQPAPQQPVPQPITVQLVQQPAPQPAEPPKQDETPTKTNSTEAPPNVGAKKLLEALVTIGNNTIQFG